MSQWTSLATSLPIGSWNKKSSVHYMIPQKEVLKTESPPEIWVWRFRSKQDIAHIIVMFKNIILLYISFKQDVYFF